MVSIIKNIFSFGLMAALVCGISMSVTSCKDDNDSKSEEQQAEEQKAQATKALKFYEVVSHLADLSAMDDATYESQTFEPIIGEESQNDPLTRVVATNNMETAARRFTDIIGLTVGSGFPASTTSYTWNDPDVGTLTYTKSTDGSSWATVDVDIKQVPHLTKIVYCTPEQMGDNGKFSGTAYYRFGDVIKRNHVSKTGQICTEYWICVRPCFGPEGKGDSHWISVGQLPEDNMFHHSGSNGTEYYVPTKVCSNEEHMQNFAEMLYAIFRPNEWQENLEDYSADGLKMFNDFKVDSIKLHNKYFWRRVQQGWRENHIAEEAFNMRNIDDLEQFIIRQGVNLLYSGYSWLTYFSWNCELYTVCFSSGQEPETKNFHQAEYGVWKKNMKNIRFDCHKMGQSRDGYKEYFAGDNGEDDNTYRWVVRYATGKQLMSSGTFNKYEGIVGCTDVWNYNRKYGPTSNLSNTPPTATPKEFVGRGFYTLGDVVRDERGNRWVCMQCSPNNAQTFPDYEHAYFVSFDRGAIGDNLQNLPSKNLAMQMMYNMESFFHNYLMTATDVERPNSIIAKNMLDHANVEIKEIVAVRDTLHAFPNKPNNKEEVLNDYVNVLYHNASGQLCVLRLVADYTASQDDGTRDMSWHFYDSYTTNLQTEPRTMLLSDLADASVISAYNKDIWVLRPWWDAIAKTSYPSPGYRTTTDNVSDLTRYIYQLGRDYRQGTAPTNMYNEPIVTFSVKRVKDLGSPASAFEDGTKFVHVSLCSDVSPDRLGEIWQTYIHHHTYETSQKQHWLNDQPYHWGMNNPIK